MSNLSERSNTRFYEISSNKSQGGKRYMRLILHEIFPDTSTWQENGISWKEEYVLKALPSLKHTLIAVEFLDEAKTEIWGHGLTDEINTPKGRMPIFEDSEVVGSFIDGYIDDIEIDGVVKRVLIGNCYIYEQRYPALTKWLEENIPLGNVKGSVEIGGYTENENVIIYEDGNKDFGRVPMDYLYTGHVLLSNCVRPADPTAIVLEINNKNNESEDEKMEYEKLLAEVKATIVETNSKNTEYETKIAESEAKVAELNASVAQLEAALTEVKAERDANWEKCETTYKEMEILREEIAKAKVKERIGELNSALVEYSDAEKAYAKDEIEAFNTDPMTFEVNSIVTKINAEIGKQAKLNAKAELERISELNSKVENIDIFGDISVGKKTLDADVEIF